MNSDPSVTRQFRAFPGFAGMGPKWNVRRSYIQLYGFAAVIALVMVAVFVVSAGNPRRGENAGQMVMLVVPPILAVVIVGWALYYWWNNRRRFVVSVVGHALTIDKRPGDVYQLSDARLGRWGMNDVTVGSALHLHSGSRRFVLGGRDHRVGQGTRLDEPPIVGVDAWLPAQQFGELLQVVYGRSEPDPPPTSTSGPLRCLLFPNAMRVQQMGGFATRKKRQLLDAASRASLAVDVDAYGLRVVDLVNNTQVTSAGNGQWTATPATYQYRGPWYRMLSVERFLVFAAGQRLSVTPEMVIHLAGMPPLRIACRDAAGVSYFKGRFAWRGDVPQLVNDPADYAVTAADWQVLVEKLGLTTYLETRG